MNLAPPIIGILRGIKADFFGPLLDAAFDAGLQAIEVTLNTAEAIAMVSAQRPRVPRGKLLGMGTVCNLDDAKKAIDAGAMFVVTPNTDEEVIDFAASCNVPAVAGAFTPTEVYKAWNCGATMIKVFPCTQLGARYIRDLLGPFDNIPLVAVGGVNRDNARTYLNAGAVAVGVGTSLFGRDAIEQERPDDIVANVRDFIERATFDRPSVKG